MDNNKTEETTHSDSTEPIISWSGVQGETQEEEVEIPHAKELHVDQPDDQTIAEEKQAN